MLDYAAALVAAVVQIADYIVVPLTSFLDPLYVQSNPYWSIADSDISSLNPVVHGLVNPILEIVPPIMDGVDSLVTGLGL